MSNTKTKVFSKTNKKKNTYIIAMSNFAGLDMFGMCKNTPLAIVKKNGEQTQSKDSWLGATHFPNPGANHMVTEYQLLKPYMGELATTIVEYLDKETGKPVLQLFPTTVHVFDGYESNYMSRLNHASRRDLQYQITKRQEMIDAYLRNNQRHK